MAPFLDDLEDDLLVCLSTMLVEAGRAVCATHQYHGESRPPADRCTTNDDGANGMAWLRRGSSTWRMVPGQSVWDNGTCGGGGNWETLIEMGVRRCIKAVSVDGDAPDPRLYDADRDMLNIDKQILYRVLCCDAWTSTPQLPYTVTSATLSPLGPLGMCSGNVLQMVITGNPMADTDDPPPGGVTSWTSQPAGSQGWG